MSLAHRFLFPVFLSLPWQRSGDPPIQLIFEVLVYQPTLRKEVELPQTLPFSFPTAHSEGHGASLASSVR